jgi:hypothetical protein
MAFEPGINIFNETTILSSVMPSVAKYRSSGNSVVAI